MVIEPLDLRIPPLDLLDRLSGEAGLAYVQGVRGHGGRRFTVLGCAPRTTIEIRADGTVLGSHHGSGAGGGEPLAALDAFVATLPRPRDDTPFPLRDAAIGYLAYDLRTAIERVPARAPDDVGLPLAFFAWYDPLLIHDDTAGGYYLASTCGRRAVEERRALVFDRLAAPMQRRLPCSDDSRATSLHSNLTLREYRAAIDRIHEHIVAGDVYQINFAQRFSAGLATDPLLLFGRLTRHHPMPLCAYLDTGSFQILSNTPELFLERRHDWIATHPIKGTRPRGRTVDDDARLRAELLTTPKERAEHVMIVDLERNDLGRICRPGSVRVQRFEQVESFPTLHHLVSTVEGKLEPHVSTGDILRATFPGGSITGAPKIRAMEIIDALEPTARGVYTGALGIIDGAGDMHLSLMIRTAVTARGMIHYGSGGGIVCDSDADAEYAESLLKAEAIFAALGTSPGNLA